MLIESTITWAAVNWPTATTASTQYAVFTNANTTPTATVATTGALVSYDDNVVTIFTVRPTDGTNYGPAQSIVVGNGISATRGWLKSYVRKRIADRIDSNTPTIIVREDELNDYISQAFQDFSLRFPIERETTITLAAGGQQQGARSYALPSDFREMTRIRYTAATQQLQYWLKELAFKGGETTSGTLVGYPKLGVLVPPAGGRFYGGNYAIWNNTLTLDFDPRGDGDMLNCQYRATFPLITSDVQPLPVNNEDLELVSLFVEAKVWEVIEGKDVRLSRWRSKEDGGRRDDLPTEKMAARVRKLYEEQVQKRLTLKPRKLRLVRSS